jgi:Ran GTPase-activating protein (RanGAP) involved in mRNA processing and transport
MIYLDKLNIKLNAILNKNVKDIIEHHTYIPFLGNTYTEDELQKWLDKRINLLSNIKISNYSDVQISNFIQNVYNTLSALDKVIANKIIAGESFNEFNPSNADNYEKLVLIILYKFVTTS